jgi:hypothetical protein
MPGLPTIPPGHVLGRLSGNGPPVLISLADLTNAILNSTNIAATAGAAGQLFQAGTVVGLTSGLFIDESQNLNVGNWNGFTAVPTTAVPNGATLTAANCYGFLLESIGTGASTITIPPGGHISAKMGYFVAQTSTLTIINPGTFVGPVGGTTTLGPLPAGTVGEIWWDGVQWITAMGPIFPGGTISGGGGGSGGGQGGGGGGGEGGGGF